MLDKGVNTIELSAYWGYTFFDYLTIKPADESLSNLSPTRQLSTPNASDAAKRLYSYLCDQYGKHIISGQQEYCGSHNYNLYADPTNYIKDNEQEFEYLQKTTGKMCAIRGIDFLNYYDGATWDDNAAERAVQWVSEYKGIAALVWHWRVPSEEGGTERNFYVESANTNYTTFSVSKALEEGTWENKVLMADIAEIAKQLKKLKDADVPVLWRPLHEAEGAWFWWGVKDRDTYDKQLYQKLWYMLYDRLENYHKLTNLIWVWNGQSKKATVNANTYDIGGMDVYPSSEDHSAQIASYNTLSKYTDDIGKMSALSEVGYIPDPEEVFKADSKVKWLYYAPWCKEFVCASNGSGAVITQLGGTPSVNTERMSEEFLKSVYSSEKVITLSELPDFKGTTKKIPEFIKSWKFNNPKLTIENDKLTAYEQ